MARKQAAVKEQGAKAGAPESIIYTNGETKHYDDFGHMDGNPPKGTSPISPDGYIDGNRY